MPDIVREFEDTLILRQGLIESLSFDLPKVSLSFIFPKRFDIQFNKAVDYRVKLPLTASFPVTAWSATRDSEFLDGLPEKWRRHGLSPLDSGIDLCHFHMDFHDGYLDVLAEDFVFVMVSR